MMPKERIIKAVEQWYIGTITWHQLSEEIDKALIDVSKVSEVET